MMAATTTFLPMHSSTTIVGVLIGVVVLFFGRKLFWLCVAAAGFALGAEIVPHLIQEPSSILGLVVALVFGVLGALLALCSSRKLRSQFSAFWREAISRVQLALRSLFILHSTTRSFFWWVGSSEPFSCSPSLTGHSSSSPLLLAPT